MSDSRSSGEQDLPPQSSNRAYQTLMRQSVKLGSAAMGAVYAAKRFLDSEIIAPKAGELFPKMVSVDDKRRASLRKIDSLRNAAKRSHEVLASADTVFPLTLFPDSVIVDRNKVTIINRTFFWTSNTVGLRIEDILNVTCSVGPFFGSLNISVRVMNSTDHFRINFFWRHDAKHLKRIIQGHMLAQHAHIDTDSLSRRELIEHLAELGDEG